MANQAVIISVDDVAVYDELVQATCVAGVDVLEERADENRLIVGGKLNRYAKRLTKQASAASAGDKPQLANSARTAKTELRKAQRQMDNA